MNDYLGDSHEAIYEMVKSGLPGQAQAWSSAVMRAQRAIFTSVNSLREVLTALPDNWSDGGGSELFTADMSAVVDYLTALGDGLSGQPASYADLVSQSAADLAAAQSPVVLPPPPSPGLDTASLRSDHALSSRVIADPVARAQSDAVYNAAIAKAEAARLQAGTTATNLDNQYRNVVARVAAPPPPPPIVLGSADPAGIEADPVGEPDGSVPGVRSPGSSRAVSGSTGAYAAAGTGAAAVGPTATAVPVGRSGSTGSGVTGFDGSASDPAGGAGLIGGVLSGGVVVGGVPGSALRRPSVVPADYAGGLSRPAVDADGLHRTVAAGDPAGRSSTGPGSAGGYDAVAGAPVTGGPALFGPGADAAGSPWDTVTGVGGIAALAVGAAFLARGAAGGVSTAGVTGFSAGGWGSVGPNTNGVTAGPATTGGPASAGPANANGGAAARGIAGTAGGVNGVNSSGGNSMIQGGQIGQPGRPAPGSPGYASGRPPAAGSGIGGEHGYRVTWLVEDRDLYGIGPSVAPVIESAGVVDSAVESATTVTPPADIL